MLSGVHSKPVITKEEIEHGLGLEAYPRWLVLRGLECLEMTGRLFHPDDFLELPSAWVNDVFTLMRWKDAKRADKSKDT